jgi:hypothetical protein
VKTKMSKKKKIPGKYAVGIFTEGLFLQVACLTKKGNKIKLVDAEIIKLAERLETVDVGKNLVLEPVEVLSESTLQDEMTPDLDGSDLVFNEPDARSEEDNIAILSKAIGKYSAKKFDLAISLAEPQIYYAYFNTQWNLQGDKLKAKIIEQLSKERQGADVLKPEDLHIINLPDGRIMVIVRDTEINLVNLIKSSPKSVVKHTPVINFVESAEISLINLVRENYDFKDNETTIIVYLGHEYSRMIFLRGNDIFNISYIIGAGLDSENISNTIYSRILLEQDNLNLPNINNILLTGEAIEADLHSFLKNKLSDGINIDYVRFANLDLPGIDPLLSRYAITIGAAYRILEENNQNFYEVDLTPREIKEGQKKFKLGPLGWFLLLLLPLLTLFTTVKTNYQQRELTQIVSQVQFNQAELSLLQEIETRLNVQRTKISQFDKAFGILDTLTVGTKTWSTFLKNLADQCQRIRHIWITDFSANSNNGVVLKGYSLYRNRIPRLARALGNTSLNKVEVQEIRDLKVYNFEIALTVPEI